MGNLILTLLKTASDEDLMMSRMNCHMEGLHSIVLGNLDGRLLRCYLADIEHSLQDNLNPYYDFSLGVHDHKYDLTFVRVTGDVYNVVYEEDKTGKGLSVDKYLFDSVLKGGNGAIKQETTGLKLIEVSLIKDCLFFDKDKLHTIYVPQPQKASWIVQEGYSMKEKTVLYTNSEVDTDNLYDSFNSPEDVKEFVKEFFEE